MTEDTALDTTISVPSMTASEAEMLLFALDRSRAQLAWKCGGQAPGGPAPDVHSPARNPAAPALREIFPGASSVN